MTKLIERRPSARADLLFLRARFRWRNSKPYEALVDLDEAVRLDPNRIRARGFQAMALQANGRYADAMAAANRVLELDPSNVEALYARGHILLEQGDYEGARNVVDELNQYDLTRSSGPFLKALIHLHTGEFEQAPIEFERARNRNQVESDIYKDWLGRAYFYAGRFDQAAATNWDLLNRTSMQGRRSPVWGIYHYLSLLEQGRYEDADGFIEILRVAGFQCSWPVPLIRFLNGELTEDVVLAKAAQEAVASESKLSRLPHMSAGHEITARTVMGVYYRAFGEVEKAREHFQWVVDRPHPLFSPDYWYCRQALEQLSEPRFFDPPPRRVHPTLTGADEAVRADEGLLAWLPLTDDLNDHGPRKLTVTVEGGVRPGNGAARFSGSGHLELPHISLKHREFAIAFWVSITGDEDAYVFVDQNGMDRCWQHLQVHLRGDLQPFLGFYVDDLVAPSSLPSRREWHHLVFQYVDDRQQIWLNGRLLVERVSPPLESRYAPTFVGRSPGWEGLHDLDGWMRDLRFYGRALPAEDIVRLADRPALMADLARRSGTHLGSAEELPPALADRSGSTTASVDFRPLLSLNGNRLTISGPPVQIYELQATLDLAGEWSAVQVLTNSTGAVGFVDEEALHLGERFFRVRLIDYQPRTD
jgi:tetratricopeptide (TPR) repeat protein